MKNVLFISTTFNSYYKSIICEFEKKGYAVDWFSDRPSNSIFTRALIRVNKNILKNKIKKYEQEILQRCISKTYDIVFVILGQSFSEDFWEKLRLIQSNAKFIYYTWDSVANFPCIEKNIKYFDYAYCFDKRDSKKFSCSFLPLFYIDDFKNIDCDIKYDFSYIGTIKPQRYQKINDLIKKLESNGYNGFKYFYLHSKVVLFYYKLKYRSEFKRLKSKQVKFKYLPKSECAQVESQSKFILDMPQKNQEGLTIRTFEALALKRKLITTNHDIINYDFYDRSNIYVVKDNYIDFNDVFFTSDYKELSSEIYEKYSISSWLDKILEGAK